MINYVWTVNQMMTIDDPEPGFVTTVVWTVTATDEQYVASYTGASKFYTQTDDFTPYENLTEEQVIGWVQNSLGSAEIQSIYDCLAIQIENQKNPPPIPESQPLPWN